MHSVEMCAGAGGQALGLEQAGYRHTCLIEVDEDACATLRANRPQWNVVRTDLRDFDARPYRGADLLAGGLPCPPFSVAGKQLGFEDERNLFPCAIRIADEVRPAALFIENVKGLLEPRFVRERQSVTDELLKLGYVAEWRLLHASDFGAPQRRPRVVMVAMAPRYWPAFAWPQPSRNPAPTVGQAVADLMAANGWEGAVAWAGRANAVAPTIVGGSKKHGGPDLGPTRARKAWAQLGVNGRSLAAEPPPPGFEGDPCLTVRMVARIQGFPDDWVFAGRKTAAYRQVGNAFPPPVARAVGLAVRAALEAGSRKVAAG